MRGRSSLDALAHLGGVTLLSTVIVGTAQLDSKPTHVLFRTYKLSINSYGILLYTAVGGPQ